MIQKLSHCTIWVLDQDRAHEFYVGKLGMEVRTDQRMGDFRWLTVGPKGQRDLELILLKISPGPMLDPKTAETLRGLVEKSALCPGAFETADVQKTYEELSRKGVRFKGPPEERPYGIECVMFDDSGNYFSVTQH
jgi:catechol 2,3-dioxygenase-like lactoylglutathione lyase family enzyme